MKRPTLLEMADDIRKLRQSILCAFEPESEVATEHVLLALNRLEEARIEFVRADRAENEL